MIESEVRKFPLIRIGQMYIQKEKETNASKIGIKENHGLIRYGKVCAREGHERRRPDLKGGNTQQNKI